jgi:hypothetical protein
MIDPGSGFLGLGEGSWTLFRTFILTFRIACCILGVIGLLAFIALIDK